MTLFTFIKDYGPIEVHADLSDYRRFGLVGSADLEYVEFPPPLVDDSKPNATRPPVGELPDLPPDPSIFVAPGTDMTIKLAKMGKVIPALDVGSCILQALFNVIPELVDKESDTEFRKGKHTELPLAMCFMLS